MSDRPVAPEDCPESFWHLTHRYCPVCTFALPDEPTPVLLGHAIDCEVYCQERFGVSLRAAEGRRLAFRYSNTRLRGRRGPFVLVPVSRLDNDRWLIAKGHAEQDIAVCNAFAPTEASK